MTSATKAQKFDGGVRVTAPPLDVDAEGEHNAVVAAFIERIRQERGGGA